MNFKTTFSKAFFYWKRLRLDILPSICIFKWFLLFVSYKGRLPFPSSSKLLMHYLCSMKIEKHVRGNLNGTEAHEWKFKVSIFLNMHLWCSLMKINCAHNNMLLYEGNSSFTVISSKSDMLKAFMPFMVKNLQFSSTTFFSHVMNI